MAQTTAVLDHPVREALAPGRMSLSALARLLLVAGAAGVIGVTLDLTQASPANALPAPRENGPAPAALPIDHWVVKNIIDDAPLEPGASVAAYDMSVDDSVAKVPAPAAKNLIEDETLEPGASVAAYGT